MLFLGFSHIGDQGMKELTKAKWPNLLSLWLIMKLCSNRIRIKCNLMVGKFLKQTTGNI